MGARSRVSLGRYLFGRQRPANRRFDRRTYRDRFLSPAIFRHLPDEAGIYRGPWVEIVFRDSAGRCWRRTKRGRLV